VTGRGGGGRQGTIDIGEFPREATIRQMGEGFEHSEGKVSQQIIESLPERREGERESCPNMEGEVPPRKAWKTVFASEKQKKRNRKKNNFVE